MSDTSVEQSFSAVIKVLNAALEHAPANTRDILRTVVQPHVAVLDQHVKNIAKPNP